MSRSYNERSVPQMRGRKQEKKIKRLCAKKARKMAIETHPEELKHIGASMVLDRETNQKDRGDII